MNMSNVLFVSVAQSYQPGMTAEELVKVAQRAWAVSERRGHEMTHLVAVYEGRPLMAWTVLDAYKTDETYKTSGSERPRIGFALGSAVPIEPGWHFSREEFGKKLRRGVTFEYGI